MIDRLKAFKESLKPEFKLSSKSPRVRVLVEGDLGGTQTQSSSFTDEPTRNKVTKEKALPGPPQLKRSVSKQKAKCKEKTQLDLERSESLC